MKAHTPFPRDITHMILSVLFICLLIASSFWIMLPFLVSLVWASIIVVATWPVLEWLQVRLAKRRGLAVAMMTVTILLIILVPITLAIITIVDNADTIMAQVRSLTSHSLSAPPISC